MRIHRSGTVRAAANGLFAAALALLGACGGGGARGAAASDVVPTADAGVPIVARVGGGVGLDGSQSRDPEGSALTFRWRQVGGPVVALAGEATAWPAFTPLVPDTYVFELAVVNDAGDAAASDAVRVLVVDDLAAAPRLAPGAVAHAEGLRRAVFLAAPPPGDLGAAPPVNVRAGGAEVRLCLVVDLASDPSDDPAPGAVVGLLRVDVVVAGVPFATLWFEAPEGDESDDGYVRFLGGGDALVHAFGVVGEMFVLDGTRSQDDGVVQTFTWTQVGGPFKFTTQTGEVALVPQVPGTYEFELVVLDDLDLGSLPHHIVVPVLPPGGLVAGPPVAAPRLVSGAEPHDLAARTFRSRSRHRLMFDDTDSRSNARGLPEAGGLLSSWRQVRGPRLDVPPGGTLDVTPKTPGAYAFELTVTDVNGVSARTRVHVSVGTDTELGPAAVLAPVPDGSLAAGLLDVVLDGSSSEARPGAAFLWSQTRGVPVVADPIALGPEFATVRIDQAGIYEFELYVQDDVARSPPARRLFVVR